LVNIKACATAAELAELKEEEALVLLLEEQEEQEAKGKASKKGKGKGKQKEKPLGKGGSEKGGKKAGKEGVRLKDAFMPEQATVLHSQGQCACVVVAHPASPTYWF
jgi:hypothetical protein